MEAVLVNDGLAAFYLMNFPDPSEPLLAAPLPDQIASVNPKPVPQANARTRSILLGLCIVIAGGIVLHYFYSAAIRAREEKDSSHTN